MTEVNIPAAEDWGVTKRDGFMALVHGPCGENAWADERYRLVSLVTLGESVALHMRGCPPTLAGAPGE